MDFGDILDQWEKQSPAPRRGGHKPKTGPVNAPSDTDAVSASEKRVNPISAWLRVNGVYDKDAEAEDAGRSSAENRRRLRSKRPDATIDIHGLTRDEAWDELERFFNHARDRGFEKVVIIHGKGNHSEGESVLKRSVGEFVERCPFAGESGHEKAVNGGSGATWVIIKGYGQ